MVRVCGVFAAPFRPVYLPIKMPPILLVNPFLAARHRKAVVTEAIGILTQRDEIHEISLLYLAISILHPLFFLCNGRILLGHCRQSTPCSF